MATIRTLPAFSTGIHLPLTTQKSSQIGSRRASGFLPATRAVQALPSRRAHPENKHANTKLQPQARDSLLAPINRAIENNFPDEDVSRVTASFSNAMAGRSLEVDKGKPSHQRAESFVDGLDASPFIDDFSGEYQWVAYLESKWDEIRAELNTVMQSDVLAQKGNNVWAPPVVEAANAYGPDWRTLVLQDRVWDPTNTQLFPLTTAILQDEAVGVPCVEAFFARQAPNTGIKLHTDDCNFIMTLHLGLNVPEDQSWIEVGGERRYWQEGKALVFNTSFFHQTMNESQEEDRLVLLLRFWHPQLTLTERRAFQYLFEILEEPKSHPGVLEAEEELSREPKKKRNKVKRPLAKGFGK